MKLAQNACDGPGVPIALAVGAMGWGPAETSARNGLERFVHDSF